MNRLQLFSPCGIIHSGPAVFVCAGQVSIAQKPERKVMETVEAFLNSEIVGIKYSQLLVSFLFIFFTLTLRRFLVKSVLRLIEKRASKTSNEWDDAIIKALKPPIRSSNPYVRHLACHPGATPACGAIQPQSPDQNHRTDAGASYLLLGSMAPPLSF